MTQHTVRCYGLMLACQARIEGMKAANTHRLDCGRSIVYNEDAFGYEAAELERLAMEVLNQ